MLTVKSRVLEYPSSVQFKEVLKLMKEAHSGVTLWSDAKAEDPMSIKPSPIQASPNYDHFFFINPLDYSQDDVGSDKLVEFNLSCAIHSHRQLERSLTDEQKRILYVEFLHAFHDMFREYPQGEILEGSVLYTIRVIREELLTFDEVDDILKGELLRELRRFDESVEWLEKVKQTQPEMSWLIDQIIEQAKNHNRKVFQIKML